MINFGKDRFKKHFANLEDIQREAFLLQLDELSLAQLYKMFKQEMYLPITRWSLPPRELLHICNDIVLKNRRSIIEFGSGYSTIFICKLIELNNLDCQFASIDSNKDWLKKIEEKLISLNLLKYVKLVHSPITILQDQNILFSEQDKWYDTNVLKNSLDNFKEFDLIIVDGPYGGTSNFARFSAAPFLRSKIKENFGVFLDNSDRAQENVIIKEWKTILGGQLLNFGTYSYLTNDIDFVVAPYGVKPYK